MSYFRPELKLKAGRMERLAMAGVGFAKGKRIIFLLPLCVLRALRGYIGLISALCITV